MWHTLNRLLALLTIILLAPLSVQAALTFGVAPADNCVIQSVTQAQRFGTYLEKRLGETVDVRIFADSNNLKDGLNIYQDVDLALISGKSQRSTPFEPLAGADNVGSQLATDLFAVRPGLDDGKRQKLQKILSDMEQDQEGRDLLRHLGVQRFSLTSLPAKAAAPRKAPTASRTTRPASKSPAPIPSSGENSGLTLGLVADSATPLSSREAAESLAGSLGQHLQQKIKIKVLPDAATLHDWLKRYRMIDLALLPGTYLQSQPGGTYTLLAQPVDLTAQSPGDRWLVARPDLDPRLADALVLGLEKLKGASLAPRQPAATRPTKTVKSTAPATLPQPKVIRHSREPHPPSAPAKAAMDTLSLGAVPGPDAFFSSTEQMRALAQQLGQRLGVTVRIQTFPDEASLQEWIIRYRMIDLAAFTDNHLKQAPAGALLSLFSAKDLGLSGAGRLVARQGLDAALLQELRQTLPKMALPPDRPEPPAVVPPVKTLAPPKSAFPAAKPEAPPTPLPASAPAATTTPPPLPAAPQLEKPTPQPEPQPVQLPPLGDREKVYLMPFITVMVPSPVAEQIFDDFVDAVSENGRDRNFEFIILKTGLDSVNPEWLATHNYVTGEIFAYVEESGCCSTDIRTKSRVSVYRQGQEAPILQYEYPVKTFFDHDYSNIAQERQKIAGHISSELAKQVRSTLHGF